jgi:hypothetical protein
MSNADIGFALPRTGRGEPVISLRNVSKNFGAVSA